MKAVLGVTGHVTFGSLLARLLKSGLMPDSYEESSSTSRSSPSAPSKSAIFPAAATVRAPRRRL